MCDFTKDNRGPQKKINEKNTERGVVGVLSGVISEYGDQGELIY